MVTTASCDRTTRMVRHHQASRDLLTLALDHGWSASYVHGEDTGGSPYISVNAAREEGEAVRVTWHTRETGTYRLFSVLIGANLAARGGTLAQAKAAITERQ